MTQIHHQTVGAGSPDYTRRKFIAGSGAAIGLSIVAARQVRGTQANQKIRVGWIGCGNRGTWLAKLFKEHGGYDIVACADYFRDRVDAFGQTIGVPDNQRFTALNGYRHVVDAKLDAVVVESPPYFHPIHAAAGTDAGKHVYVAKPIAVDVPGCRTIERSGQKATANRRCFLVDFQTRADPFYLEALKRVHAGAIGRYAFGESSYHAGVPWKGQISAAREAKTNPEARLRAWGLDKVLSGDIITEQNIHTIDVASWIIGQAPVSAFGTGGRKVRNYGDCWDTFSVTFQYPDSIGVAFSSRQFNGYGTQPDGIRNRMFGSDGVLETKYGGEVMIRGTNFWRGGSSPGIYKDGAVTNITTFHRSITTEQFDNPTVAPSVRSNLTTILGRTAAYRGEVVTWDQILADDQPLEINLKGLKT